MTKPKPASSLRSKLKEYVEAAYLHGLPCENLHTGELEPPRDISDTEWIVDSILSLVAQEVKKARLDELIKLSEHVDAVSKNAKNTLDIIKGFTERIKHRLERLG